MNKSDQFSLSYKIIDMHNQRTPRHNKSTFRMIFYKIALKMMFMKYNEKSIKSRTLSTFT